VAQLQDWFHKYNGYSFSRHRQYNLCKRTFYYRYIARYLVDPGTLSVPRLKRLGELNSRYMLQGKLVHDIIEKEIKSLHRGDGMDPVRAKEALVRQVDSHFNLASEVLTEYHNGQSVDEEFFETAREKGQDHLDVFFNDLWPPVAKRDYLEHEEFEEFHLPDVRVILKTDYVSQVGENVVVTDWKTGDPEKDTDHDFQVAIYLLWAMDKYGKPFENVRGELAYLSEGYIKPLTFDQEQLESYGERIVRGFEEMNASYEADAFPPDPRPGKCISCQFATICEDSMHGDYLQGEEETTVPDA
jgi:CRISPR/Cas system-associated exonuclease Cas4 (RecB family)